MGIESEERAAAKKITYIERTEKDVLTDIIINKLEAIDCKIDNLAITVAEHSITLANQDNILIEIKAEVKPAVEHIAKIKGAVKFIIIAGGMIGALIGCQQLVDWLMRVL
jgi:hypothetical protein